MPDTLVNLTTPASTPIAWQPDSELFRLRRELASAEDALNTGLDDDKAAPAYHAAHDRFLEAPVHSIAGVLLKLERLADLEEMEASSIRAPDRIVRNLMRDLRAGLPGPKASLDVVALHRAADKEVDEIYRHQGRISGALQVLDEIAGRIVGESFGDETKVRFLLDVMTEAADAILSANDRLTNAINPLNPVVLGDGPV